MENKDIIYKDRLNGQNEYFTYSDGNKVIVPEKQAKKWVEKGTAKIIKI